MTQRKNIIRIITGLVALGVAFALLWVWFHRVPERDIPVGNVVVSPADGVVIHTELSDEDFAQFFKNDIKQIVDVSMIGSPYHIVVIEMNIHNVHVQRAPIAGSIVHQTYLPGSFRNAIFSEDKERLVNVNEKNIAVFENDDGLRIGVIQVAGMVARTIRSWNDVGDTLTKGEPYGMIKLGSQVVVVLPEHITLDVQAGDRLTDGESIIGYIAE